MKRTTLAKGIYLDDKGVAIRVPVTGRSPMQEWHIWGRSDLMPATRGEKIDISKLIARRKWLRGDASRLALPPIKSGTLAADVKPFIETMPAGDKRDGHERRLTRWVQELGATPRSMITRQQVLAVRARLLEEFAPNTVNHYVNTLRQLYYALDGRETMNPTFGIERAHEGDYEDRDMPVWLAEKLIDSMPDHGHMSTPGGTRPDVNLTKIRLRIILWTGLPHTQIARLLRIHFDAARGCITVQPRKKGKAARRRPMSVPLLPQGLAALKDFDAANLWGVKWSRSAMRKSWHRCIERVRNQAAKDQDTRTLAALEQLPANSRPYDLRHTFATEALARGYSPDDVALLMMHSGGSKMVVERYGRGAQETRMAAVVAHWSAELTGTTPPPAVRTGDRGTGARVLDIKKRTRGV